MSFSFLNRFLTVLAFILLILPLAAIADDDTDGNPPAPALKVAPIFLTCFTIQPDDPKQGEEPRSCNDLCMEKIAVCTGVQSNMGPPPSCEDEMYKGAGNCRCCKVQQ